MIPQDNYTVTDTGEGFELGELTKPLAHLHYLAPTALVGRFDGLDTMFDYMQKAMPTPKREGSSSNGEGGSFNAFDSYEQAIDTFRNHPEKVTKFDESELRIKDDSESGNQVEYDVTGDFLDMGRYMEGVPESMGQMHNGNARNRRVNILIDSNYMSYINHEHITHRSERVLRLVDGLEAGGVRTQITLIESNECGHIELILKRHDEPLTIADLAVVTHPEFLRRIIFRVNEYSKTWQSGYGRATCLGNAMSNYPDKLLHSDNNNELNIFVGANMTGKPYIDREFDKLEKLLVWEMSKPVPEVDAVKITDSGIYFNPNGYRSAEEIKQEGVEVMGDE